MSGAQVWVEDHQNCWGKGCHGGRADDEGFPIPKTIPAVIGPEANMSQHATTAEFIAYLDADASAPATGQTGTTGIRTSHSLLVARESA